MNLRHVLITLFFASFLATGTTLYGADRGGNDEGGGLVFNIPDVRISVSLPPIFLAAGAIASIALAYQGIKKLSQEPKRDGDNPRKQGIYLIAGSAGLMTTVMVLTAVYQKYYT